MKKEGKRIIRMGKKVTTDIITINVKLRNKKCSKCRITMKVKRNSSKNRKKITAKKIVKDGL